MSSDTRRAGSVTTRRAGTRTVLGGAAREATKSCGGRVIDQKCATRWRARCDAARTVPRGRARIGAVARGTRASGKRWTTVDVRAREGETETRTNIDSTLIRSRSGVTASTWTIQTDSAGDATCPRLAASSPGLPRSCVRLPLPVGRRRRTRTSVCEGTRRGTIELPKTAGTAIRGTRAGDRSDPIGTMGSGNVYTPIRPSGRSDGTANDRGLLRVETTIVPLRRHDVALLPPGRVAPASSSRPQRSQTSGVSDQATAGGRDPAQRWTTGRICARSPAVTLRIPAYPCRYFSTKARRQHCRGVKAV